MKNSNYLRVQLKDCIDIDLFLNHISEGDVVQYMNFFRYIVISFFKNNNETPQSLKQGILLDIQQFIVPSEESFKEYAEKKF